MQKYQISFYARMTLLLIATFVICLYNFFIVNKNEKEKILSLGKYFHRFFFRLANKQIYFTRQTLHNRKVNACY
jgi:hypothetical protein